MVETVSAHIVPTGGSADRPVVAIDTTPLLGSRTGIGNLVHGLVAALEAADEVAVRRYEVTWRGRSARAQRLPMPARPLHAAWARGARVPIEWFVGRVDVVHGTNYVVPPARHAQRLVSVHDLTALRFPALVEAASIRSLHLAGQAIDGGAVVHADSAFVADEIRNWNPRADVRVIHPGVPQLGPAGPLPTAVAGRRYVLALGTVEPRKDYPGLVQALPSLPADVLLVVAGAPGWGSPALHSAVMALGDLDRRRVVRLGFVDDPTRAALIRNAAVFAYPSLYEGFGLPVLEAMAAGTPVVTTTAGSLPEVAGDAAMMVAPNDPAALADALRSALEGKHPHPSAGIRRAGAFSWGVCADRFRDLYRELAAASGKGRPQ